LIVNRQQQFVLFHELVVPDIQRPDGARNLRGNGMHPSGDVRVVRGDMVFLVVNVPGDGQNHRKGQDAGKDETGDSSAVVFGCCRRRIHEIVLPS